MLERLAALGHRIEAWPERKYLAGSVCTIQSDLRSGVKWAGADPKKFRKVGALAGSMGKPRRLNLSGTQSAWRAEGRPVSVSVNAASALIK